MVSILDLIHRESGLMFRKVRPREYAGACPFCNDGDDRFRIWPDDDKPRYWCRRCERKGDAIQFCRDFLNLSFREACEYVGQPPTSTSRRPERSFRRHPQVQSQPPPAGVWSDRAQALVTECQQILDSSQGQKAREWLHKRGFTDETIEKAGLGLNPADRYESRSVWGLPELIENGRSKDVWIPKGVVIPWVIDGQLWRVNLRRPVGEPKYIQLPGGASVVLYNGDALTCSHSAVLVEGEFDALSIESQAGDLVTVVATGSTQGARRAKWIARLAVTPLVLVAFDSDANGAGDQAAKYWLEVLKNARRWRPWWNDANTLLQDNVDVRSWITAGLKEFGYLDFDSSKPDDPRHQRLQELTGRHLAPEEKLELQQLAGDLGVDLAWKRVDINGNY